MAIQHCVLVVGRATAERTYVCYNMPMQNGGAVELQERIGVLAARINAATAELVQLSADLDTDGSWAEIGVRSCAHWLSINIGCDV